MADKNFERLNRDDNRVPIQTANGFVTQDADSPAAQTSPLAYSDTEIEIVVPANAAEVVFFPSTDMRVSEVTGMAHYYKLKGGSVEAFGVADTDSIYVVRDSADGVLNFRFLTI